MLAIVNESDCSLRKRVNTASGAETWQPRSDISLKSSRQLQSIDGCDLGDSNCRRRRCLLQEMSLDGLTLYAFIAGIPKVFEVAPGHCVDPDQHRRVRSAFHDFHPTGSTEQRGRRHAPPDPNDLPRIYVCKSNLQLLQVHHPPYHDGAYNDTPYVLAPQWNLGPLGTLHHNLKTLGKLSSGSSPTTVTMSGETPTPASWKHDTHFRIYPEPFLQEHSNYRGYFFQFPGAPAVDENGVEL